MKKIVTLSAAISVLAMQQAQAHSSHSEGLAHAGEHLWFALIPAALWVAYRWSKKSKDSNSDKRG